MKLNEIKADQVITSVTGTFTTEHVFNTSAGILGVLELKPSKGKGSFQSAEGNIQYDFDNTAFLKPNYELKENGIVLASSEKRSVLGRQLLIQSQEKKFLLLPGGGKLRSWGLWDNKEQKICEVQPLGVFKRGARILIRQEISIPLLVFVYCLVLKRWQDESSAA